MSVSSNKQEVKRRDGPTRAGGKQIGAREICLLCVGLGLVPDELK